MDQPRPASPVPAMDHVAMVETLTASDHPRDAIMALLASQPAALIPIANSQTIWRGHAAKRSKRWDIPPGKDGELINAIGVAWKTLIADPAAHRVHPSDLNALSAAVGARSDHIAAPIADALLMVDDHHVAAHLRRVIAHAPDNDGMSGTVARLETVPVGALPSAMAVCVEYMRKPPVTLALVADQMHAASVYLGAICKRPDAPLQDVAAWANDSAIDPISRRVIADRTQQPVPTIDNLHISAASIAKIVADPQRHHGCLLAPANRQIAAGVSSVGALELLTAGLDTVVDRARQSIDDTTWSTWCHQRLDAKHNDDLTACMIRAAPETTQPELLKRALQLPCTRGWRIGRAQSSRDTLLYLSAKRCFMGDSTCWHASITAEHMRALLPGQGAGLLRAAAGSLSRQEIYASIGMMAATAPERQAGLVLYGMSGRDSASGSSLTAHRIGLRHRWPIIAHDPVCSQACISTALAVTMADNTAPFQTMYAKAILSIAGEAH